MSSRWADRLRFALPLRLAVWYGVLFAASGVVLLAVTDLLLAQSLRTRDHDLIRSTLERYANEYRIGGLAALDRAISIDRLEGRHERLFVRVLDGESQAIFFNLPSDWDGFDLSRIGRDDGAGALSWLTLAGRRNASVLEIASARLDDGTLFQVGRSSEARDDILRHFRSRSVIVFLCVVAFAAFGGALLTWVGLAPLRELTTTVRTIVQTGRLEERVAMKGTRDALDELGALVNRMLDRMSRLVSGMRGALDNVAHDLRTPLARLRAIIESGLSSADQAAAREALARALDETDRVNAMLTTLMDISEAETGSLRLAHQRVSLGELVRETCDIYADAAEDKGLTLEADVADAITLSADRPRLRQALANLIDNAVKYTDRGHVRVSGTADDGHAVIVVTDSGPGIPDADLPRIWDRLFRGDASRSERGIGLGLSLVKAIVEAHGGTVAVASRPGRGSEFRLVLPLRPSAGGAHGQSPPRGLSPM